MHLRTTECSALIDSGSERCSMTEACAEKCGMTSIIDKTYQSPGASGGRVHHVPVSFAQQGAAVTFEAAFDIRTFPDTLADYDCVIGVDFLVRYEASLDFGVDSSCKFAHPSGAYVTVAFNFDRARQDKEVAEARSAANLAVRPSI